MDLIFYNGKIMTVEKNAPQVEAIAIKGNKIKELGTTTDILKLKTDTTKMIDLEGKLMLPGFNDSHLHLYSCGIEKQNVNLNHSHSIDEIIKRIQTYIEEHKVPVGHWVVGEGWNQDAFTVGEKRFPTKEDLDKASVHHPIYITRSCYHIMVGNTLALETGNITKDSHIIGGEIDLGKDENPNGILRESATQLVTNLVRESVDKEAFKRTIEFITPFAHKEGITSVHSDDISRFMDRYEMVIDGFKELESEGKLKIRIYEQSRFYDTEKLQAFIDKGYISGVGNEYFKIGSLKMIGDGSLGARTAALSRPYADAPNESGMMVIEAPIAEALVSLAHKHDIHTATHCIGDKAADIFLTAIEKALIERPKKDHRHSIVHSQINSKETIEKYKELEVLSMMQPIFIESDTKIVEARVGKELAEYSYDARKFLDAGIRVAFGSDSPIEPFNVIQGIYHAVTMKDLAGWQWRGDKAVTVEEAVYAFTLAGAYASFEENIKGSIKTGKLADLVVLSADIYTISPDDIKDVQVEMTVFDGEIVYTK